MNDEVASRNDTPEDTNKTKTNKKSWLIKGGVVAFSALLLGGGYYGYLYASTPEHLRNPAFEHYHFRTQIIVNGEPIDFSQKEFQEEYDKTSCSADIGGQPVDFHDGMDQMAHIHWRGVTGGEFLKYYGWNFIGGADNQLGRRYDQGMMKMQRIDTAGKLLPTPPDNPKFYVYVGDEDGYEQKDWNDFLHMNIEDFFGKKSLLNTSNTTINIFDLFTQKVFAHGMVDDGHQETNEGENEKDRLERINNLVGNVVLFVQENEPTAEQIKDRFANLVPLQDSVCGG